MSTQPLAELEAAFSDERYVRERLFPQPGDGCYLVLSDLVLALTRLETSEPLTILDYGAGSSPYRSLFPNSEYRRADITPFANPDYRIRDDGTVPERSDVFDLVLSTQVLEHVDNPDSYLAESFRLLKPGGTLALTTHGTYEDHGCPYDFRRWTADGLRRDVEKAGFNIMVMEKVTTGPRAIMFLVDRYLVASHFSTRSMFGSLHWICRAVLSRLRPWVHKRLDLYCSNHRVVSTKASNHSIYICLLCCARRPY